MTDKNVGPTAGWTFSTGWLGCARTNGRYVSLRGSSLVVRSVPVLLPTFPDHAGGLRIAHISDLHLRRWTHTLDATQSALLGLEYDFLVVTGDFCDAPSRWRHAVSLADRFFEPLVNKSPVYAVLGNHDHAKFAECCRGLTFLCNESRAVRAGAITIELVGLEQTGASSEDLSAALPCESQGTLTVLLAHYPSTVFRLPLGRVDIQLSGHTHGGQIRPPWLGCLWTNDRISRRLSRGLHRVGTCMLHVNPGIGVSRPVRLRFNCPPEVSLVTVGRRVPPVV